MHMWHANVKPIRVRLAGTAVTTGQAIEASELAAAPTGETESRTAFLCFRLTDTEQSLGFTNHPTAHDEDKAAGW